MIACNNALDAEESPVSAVSPADSLRIEVASPAVMPTTSRFSVNIVNCSPASVSVLRASVNLNTRSLQEQRR